MIKNMHSIILLLLLIFIFGTKANLQQATDKMDYADPVETKTASGQVNIFEFRGSLVTNVGHSRPRGEAKVQFVYHMV
jgi:hypothetical protein